MRQIFGRYVADDVVNVLLAEDRKLDLAGEMKNGDGAVLRHPRLHHDVGEADARTRWSRC